MPNKRTWTIIIVSVAGGLIALAALPFVVYLVYAMVCQGPDCFR